MGDGRGLRIEWRPCDRDFEYRGVRYVWVVVEDRRVVEHREGYAGGMCS